MHALDRFDYKTDSLLERDPETRHTRFGNGYLAAGALPKEQRKQFVPVPAAAARCLRDVENAKSKTAVVAEWIARESQKPMTEELLLKIPLPEHLRLNIRVTNLDERVVGQGRDLTAVRRELRRHSSNQIATSQQGTRTIYRSWEFGDLPREHFIERGSLKFAVYPAIVPYDDGVILKELAAAAEAQAASRWGVLRLAILALPQQVKYARQQFKEHRELALLSRGLQANASLVDAFAERVFLDCFLPIDATLPQSRLEFDQLLDLHRANVGATVQQIGTTLLEILQALHSVRQLREKAQVASFKTAAIDVDRQLQDLLPDGFLVATPAPWFGHLARFLRAIARRLERLPANPRRDAESMSKLAPFVTLEREIAKQSNGVARPEFERLRWMIEEYRVSLFAQELKTSLPVSDPRLAEQAQRAREESTR